MTAVGDILIQDAWQALLREATTATAPLELAFIRWLFGDLIPDSPICDKRSTDPSPYASGFNDYREVAVMGFQLASGGNSIPPAPGDLERGLHWIAGRSPIAGGTTMGFVTDAVALFGIALGARASGNTLEVSQWLQSFSDHSLSARSIEAWERCLIIAALSAVGTNQTSVFPTGADVSDLRVILRTSGLLLDDSTVEQDNNGVLELVKRDVMPLGVRKAAIRLAALAEVTRSSPTVTLHHVSISQVSDLLRRIPAAMRRWTWESVSRTGRPGSQARQWHIDNEYHVQNLLWTILAPIFPDLDDEVYTPSVGQVTPRADLYVPNLKLLIEVKVMNQGKNPKNIIREVAEDASLYLQDPTRHQHILAFIWDETARTEQHELLIKGLRHIQGVVDAIVVSRPGGWN